MAGDKNLQRLWERLAFIPNKVLHKDGTVTSLELALGGTGDLSALIALIGQCQSAIAAESLARQTLKTNFDAHVIDNDKHFTSQDKMLLNTIKTTGTGDRFLADDGTYRTLPAGTGSGGGTGTNDYNVLINRPQLYGQTLVGGTNSAVETAIANALSTAIATAITGLVTTTAMNSAISTAITTHVTNTHQVGNGLTGNGSAATPFDAKIDPDTKNLLKKTAAGLKVTVNLDDIELELETDKSLVGEGTTTDPLKVNIDPDTDNLLELTTSGLLVKHSVTVAVEADEDTITGDGTEDNPLEVIISEEADNMLEKKADGLYVKKVDEVAISEDEDNAIEQKADGLFAPKQKEEAISEEEGNILERKEDGLFVPETDLTDYAKTEDLPTSLEDLTNPDENPFMREDDVDDKIKAAQLAVYKPLPAVDTVADLPTPTERSINYLCRVKSEQKVYALLTDATGWTVYSDKTDFVMESELTKAIEDHNEDEEAHKDLFDGKVDSVVSQGEYHAEIVNNAPVAHMQGWIENGDGAIVRVEPGKALTASYSADGNFSEVGVTPTEVSVTTQSFKVNGKEVSTESARAALKGKTFSLLGDSISTFSGTMPAGNAAYYPRTGAGQVTLREHMYWGMLEKNEGMELLVNEAWSGSRLVGTSGSATLFRDAPRKLHKVVDGVEVQPDYVFIYLGTNDFSGGVPVGSADATKGYDIESNPADFSTAYAVMLGRIQSRYPKAKVIACTIAFRTGGAVFPESSGSLEGHAARNQAIRQAATMAGAKVCDFANCGIHRYNLADVMGDGTLHPNIEGMKLMYEELKNTMLGESTAQYNNYQPPVNPASFATHVQVDERISKLFDKDQPRVMVEDGVYDTGLYALANNKFVHTNINDTTNIFFVPNDGNVPNNYGIVGDLTGERFIDYVEYIPRGNNLGSIYKAKFDGPPRPGMRPTEVTLVATIRPTEDDLLTTTKIQELQAEAGQTAAYEKDIDFTPYIKRFMLDGTDPRVKLFNPRQSRVYLAANEYIGTRCSAAFAQGAATVTHLGSASPSGNFYSLLMMVGTGTGNIAGSLSQASHKILFRFGRSKEAELSVPEEVIFDNLTGGGFPTSLGNANAFYLNNAQHPNTTPYYMTEFTYYPGLQSDGVTPGDACQVMVFNNLSAERLPQNGDFQGPAKVLFTVEHTAADVTAAAAGTPLTVKLDGSDSRVKINPAFTRNGMVFIDKNEYLAFGGNRAWRYQGAWPATDPTTGLAWSASISTYNQFGTPITLGGVRGAYGSSGRLPFAWKGTRIRDAIPTYLDERLEEINKRLKAGGL